MTEPNAEGTPADAPAAESRPRVQKVNLSAKGIVEVPDSDERVAALVRMGLTLVEARAAVSAVGLM